MAAASKDVERFSASPCMVGSSLKRGSAPHGSSAFHSVEFGCRDKSYLASSAWVGARSGGYVQADNNVSGAADRPGEPAGLQGPDGVG